MPKQTTNLMIDFRIASRDLFNRYFHIDNPWENPEFAWLLVERFNELEDTLFRKMVSEALNAGGIRYGQPQTNVLAVAQTGCEISALINREVDSGYWDFPIPSVPNDAVMQFMAFFDWDALSIRDNKYVRARIASCSSNSILVGKHVLLDAQQVSYTLCSN